MTNGNLTDVQKDRFQRNCLESSILEIFIFTTQLCKIKKLLKGPDRYYQKYHEILKVLPN